MKSLILILSVLLISVYSFAQVAAPSPTPVIAVVQPHAELMQMIGFAVAAILAIMDFIFAINPNIAANGVIHALYLGLKNIAAKPEDK